MKHSHTCETENHHAHLQQCLQDASSSLETAPAVKKMRKK